MKMLQSKSGNCYEFDPYASPVSEDGYWLCFDGYRLPDMMSMPVVIYFIRPGDVEIVENLLAWLNSIPESVFNHPNIICPTDYVEETDHASNVRGAIKNLYIICPTNDGVSLSGLMQGETNGKPLEFSNPMCELYKNDRIHFAKTITIETLKILEHLHNLGISIGCIDPDFILLTNDNKIKINFIETFYWHQVKQAVTYNQGLNPQATVIAFCGIIGGKYNEMVAPELLYGCTDARVDLYSTGILLFYLITGHLPFNGNSDIMMSLNRDVPLHEIEDEQLRRIIKKAIEKNPAKRFQSAMEFINALDKSINIRIPWYKRIVGLFQIKENMSRLIT